MSTTNRSSQKTNVRDQKTGRNGRAYARQKEVFFRAQAEDETTGDTFAVYRFAKPCGRRGTIHLPLEEAINPRLLCAQLISKNWIGALDLDARARLAEMAQDMRPREHWLCSTSLGWRPDDQAFVLQNQVLGKRKKELKIKPPLWMKQKAQFKTGRAGDLQGWIDGVARPCQRSTRLMTVLSAAFAAPLLKPLGLASFGINLHGRSKSGKSTALLAVGSVIGIGEESQLPNFNATDASLFELGRLCNDGPMPLNEAGLIDGQKRDAYSTYQRLIYGLSEGKDRVRHSASTYATDASGTGFRIIYLANSEHPISVFAQRAGRVRDHGEYARCWDVPAVSEGCKTVFDLGSNGNPQKVSTRRARERLRNLRNAVQRHHGWAMKAFVQYLLEHPDTFRDQVGRHIEEFFEQTKTVLAAGEIQHAARNFGLVYAAGRLAIAAGILPWNRTVLRKSILTCFCDGYSLIPKDEPLEVAAVRILREKLRQISLPVKEKHGIDPGDEIGFVKQIGNGVQVTIRSTTFRDWFPDSMHLSACLHWLLSKGYLKSTRRSHKFDRGFGYEWAVTTPRWRGGHKVKSIVFYKPA